MGGIKADSIRTPYVVREDEAWTVVFKPHGMPTAPLTEGERGTLLAWYLELHPEAAAVTGKKAIEKGLVHRLDTPTEGLVLFAKKQSAFDSFQRSQDADALVKRYLAVCDINDGIDAEALRRRAPFRIESRFRSWGIGAREVRPVFPDDRRWASSGRDYRTELAAIEREGTLRVRCNCSLTRGFRHQIRAHLASIGLPIAGDALYNPRVRSLPDPEPAILGLSAIGLAFPDPDSGSIISISLP